MISRRLFLSAGAPLALGACASTGSLQSTVKGFADKLYTDVNVVAAYLEAIIKQVVAKTMTVASAAQALLAQGEPYVVPALKIFVSLVKLAGQVAAANGNLAGNAKVQSVLGQATTLANNPIVQSAVATNTMPSDPLTIVTGLIDLGSQIYALTGASPTAAAQSA